MVAHSMGNYLLYHALCETEESKDPPIPSRNQLLEKIATVMFAAPDVGRPEFQRLVWRFALEAGAFGLAGKKDSSPQS